MNLLNPGSKKDSDSRILDKANVSFSTISIAPNEALLVKLAPHMKDFQMDILALVTSVFKENGAHERVIVFTEGDISFEKVIMKK